MMGNLFRASASLAALFIGVDAARSDEHRPAAIEISVASECLALGDRVFETSLVAGLPDEDLVLLTNIYSTATVECLTTSIGGCDHANTDELCLPDLAAWVRKSRAGIVSELPEAILAESRFVPRRYSMALARAVGDADREVCGYISDELERERYCEILAETAALESAYYAWRLARRHGAVPLEGHQPVDLEMLR